LTNKHLFSKYSKKYYIKINNTFYDFDIIKKYEKKDLVLWKINNYKNINFLEVNKSKNLKSDTVVFIINNKQRNYWKIILLNKELINLKLNNLIETNIKLKPWNSWSPLFDKNWIVIGINTAINEVKDTSFAEVINIFIF
jgi:S1-C subfamily serine protease